MPLGDITLHLAARLRPKASEEWSEGEPAVIEDDPDRVEFDCFLQLPDRPGEEDEPIGNRRVKRPTIKYEPFDDPDAPGAEFSPGLRAGDRVEVTAEELTGPDPVTWIVYGDPVPYSPPGDIIGYEAHLTRVEE